jgi:hypothetical protein
VFVLFICNLGIAFLIPIDFVYSLPDYFAFMLPALILVLVVTLYRVSYAMAGLNADWANFSPVAAVLLCSAAYLPRKAVFLAALGPLVVADILINAHYHAPFVDTGMLSRYFCFGLILLLGFIARKQQKYKTLSVFALTFAGSCFFFLFTNTESWFALAGYQKTLQGWRQAMTTGLPGYPPTLLFFRNTVLGDLFFTAVFLATQAISAKSRAALLYTGSPDVQHQT